MDFTQPWTSFTGVDLHSVLMAIILKIRESLACCRRALESLFRAVIHETQGKCWLSNEATYCPAPYVYSTSLA